MIKKIIYISLFIFLGIVASFLVHAAIEILAISLLVKDFERYGLGLSWRQWYAIHHIGSALLLFFGIAAGYWQGKYWWKIIYVDKKYDYKHSC